MTDTSATPAHPGLSETRTDRLVIDRITNFWERIHRARHVSLFLDFDGTLAPFHADRLKATPLPGTVDAVLEIARQPDTMVALVSGRPISELLLLFGDHPVLMIGAHGYEVHRPDGQEHVSSITPEQSVILDAAYEEALAIFDHDRVERKVASVAVHFRGLDPRAVGEVEDQIERRWRAAGTSELVEFRPFNGGLELRASGRTKGTAIAELLNTLPGDTLPVYIGDDDTDEDAFGVLVDRGIGIKVGPVDAVTKAHGRVPDCEAVRQLLIEWSTARTNE